MSSSRLRSLVGAIAVAILFQLAGAVLSVATARADTPPGCVAWPADRFLQTPWTRQANGTGWATQSGSYYGDGLHQGCDRALSVNDYYALDFGLRPGDAVLAPGGPGVVRYAGWAQGGWCSFGQVVIVDHGGGWWSQVAHLSAIGVHTGQRVTAGTTLGTVGGSGCGSPTYWGPHLHAALYLNPRLDAAHGGLYGGRSAEPRNMRFFGNGGGAYPRVTRGMRLSW